MVALFGSVASGASAHFSHESDPRWNLDSPGFSSVMRDSAIERPRARVDRFRADEGLNLPTSDAPSPGVVGLFGVAGVRYMRRSVRESHH
jgi:hypothetical protein